MPFFFTSRKGQERFLVLGAAALAIFVLYAPQPLLPLYADLYGLSESAAGLLMTVTMLPLAIAPLSYGYLLGFIQPLQLLRISLLLLAFLTVITGLADSFSRMLLIRFLQGLVIPAALTAVMAYLALPGAGGALQRGMSLYVAATISGGFLGRFLSGVSSALVDWRIFFFVLGGFLLAGGLLIRPRAADPAEKKIVSGYGVKAAWDVLRSCLYVYAAIFLLFLLRHSQLSSLQGH